MTIAERLIERRPECLRDHGTEQRVIIAMLTQPWCLEIAGDVELLDFTDPLFANALIAVREFEAAGSEFDLVDIGDAIDLRLSRFDGAIRPQSSWALLKAALETYAYLPENRIQLEHDLEWLHALMFRRESL